MQVELLAAADQGSCGIRHIKLEVVRTGILLLFSIKSIIQKEVFINFSLIVFLKVEM